MNNARKKGWIIGGIMAVLVVIGMISTSYAGSDYFSKGVKAIDNGNYQAAIKLYKKACDGGNAKGCFKLGILYDNGRVVSQNYSIAAKFYKKACYGGNAEGCTYLAMLYLGDNGITLGNNGVKKDMRLYTKYRNMNYVFRNRDNCNKGNAAACIYVGTAYEKGKGVETNYEIAIKYYKKACKLGNINGCKYAKQKKLKKRFRNVNNAQQAYQKGNYLTAARISKKFCNNGDAQGCFNLGILYANGYGVSQSYSIAAKLYKKACDGGDAKGCFNLGILYYWSYGGLTGSDSAAAKLYKKACDGGVVNGCLNLGNFYDQGQGVKMNKIKAYNYWMMAARQGNASAQHNLDILCQKSPWACK